MLNKLLKLANYLDNAGLTKEADQVDALIKVVAGRHELYRALKNDDVDGAIKGLVGMNNEDLGIGSDDFKKLTKDLTKAKSFEAYDPAESARCMELARKRVGVEKPVPQTTKTHNPATGLPWSSGPVAGEESQSNENKRPYDLDDWEKNWFTRQVQDRGMLNRKINKLKDLDFQELGDYQNEIDERAYVAGLHNQQDLVKKLKNLSNKINYYLY